MAKFGITLGVFYLARYFSWLSARFIKRNIFFNEMRDMVRRFRKNMQKRFQDFWTVPHLWRIEIYTQFFFLMYGHVERRFRAEFSDRDEFMIFQGIFEIQLLRFLLLPTLWRPISIFGFFSYGRWQRRFKRWSRLEFQWLGFVSDFLRNFRQLGI